MNGECTLVKGYIILKKEGIWLVLKVKINLLKQQLEETGTMEKQRAEQLKHLAAEYTLLGKESEKEGMPQAAIRNYEKASELWLDLAEVKRKLKKLKSS